MNIENFKIVIKARKIPIIDNPIIEYIEDKGRQTTHLYSEIYHNSALISKGVILDFYKKFENIEDFFGNMITRIKTFEWYGRLYTKNTYFGQKIYELKNFNDPPIDNSKRESYLNEIASVFEPYIRSLIEHDVALTSGYVPSSSKIPDEIAHRLAQIFQLPLKSFIQKNSDVPSKQLTVIDEQTFNKYMLDFSKLDKNSTFLIIDDVVGTGATICEIMYKLYNFNKKTNYFLAIVKDVKR